MFGPKNTSANYGMVYTAKGLASVFAGFGAPALAAYLGGSFAVAFYISAILCAIASLFSLFVLRPLVRARIARKFQWHSRQRQCRLPRVKKSRPKKTLWELHETAFSGPAPAGPEQSCKAV